MKKLIFVTQKLAYGDPLMGFSHAWVEALARQVETLVVITNELGEVRLNPQPRIYSLGKEHGHSRWKKLVLLNAAVKAESDASAFFCHQCPIYLLSALPNLLHMPRYLWYAHGHLSHTARMASLFVRKVFTSTPFALPLYTHKKQIMGQGVETAKWQNTSKVFSENRIRMVHVGRLSAVKNLLPMVYLVKTFKDKGIKATLDLIGDPATTEDKTYRTELQEDIQKLGVKEDVHFLGGLSHDKIREALLRSDFSLNFSTSAAIDKSLIETAAAGLIPISYNPSFIYTIEDTPMVVPYQKNKTADALILNFFGLSQTEKQSLGQSFAKLMAQKHDLDSLAKRLVTEMENGNER